MADFAGGHPTTETAAQAVQALDKELGGDGIEFHPGVQYRHILVAPADWADALCTPPHDLTGRAAVWPTGPAAPRLQELMHASRDVLARFDLAANSIWLWGQGRQPRIPSFADTYGLQAGLVSAVDLVRGLGALTGIRIADAPGITGWYDTDYEAKRDACLRGLADGDDLFLIHVEASDEAGHAGNVEEKVKALENWDRRILGPLVNALDIDDFRPWRLLLLPDHATPLALRTHTSEPVPYMLVDSEVDGAGGVYTEAGTAGCPPVAGHTLMNHLITQGP
jgi:2,3-bisphosphoglycerate-independent phosphoglycerate mutase